MPKISTYTRLLSYLAPVKLRDSAGTQNPVLELFLYRGQYQLATIDAMYSDGDRYRPMVIAFKHLKEYLPAVKDVLVLGTGLGSAVRVLDKMGFHPSAALVEHDSTVLKWALELMPEELNNRLVPVCADAEAYMANNTITYDLILTDIFNSRVVPDFVTSEKFLKQCRNSLKPGGHWVLNYIVQKNMSWEEILKRIGTVFPDYHVLKHGINRIVVAKV